MFATQFWSVVFYKLGMKYIRSLKVLINGQLVSPALKSAEGLDGFGFWRLENSSLVLTNTTLQDATLDLVVENWGRVNYGHLPQFHQLKG